MVDLQFSWSKALLLVEGKSHGLPLVQLCAKFKKMLQTGLKHRLGNGSKNGLIKLKVCSPSGRWKSFHSRGLSALVTRTSMQVSPPAPPCAAS